MYSQHKITTKVDKDSVITIPQTMQGSSQYCYYYFLSSNAKLFSILCKTASKTDQ